MQRNEHCSALRIRGCGAIVKRRVFISLSRLDHLKPLQLKRAANLAKGSAEPNKNKVGTVTRKQVEEIAKTKLPDLNCDSLESAVKSVAGTARSMGIDVIG